MLNGRERHQLAVIEHELTESSFDLERKMRRLDWRCTPRTTPRPLPGVLLLVGVFGLLILIPFYARSLAGLLVVGGGSAALVLRALFTLPSSPSRLGRNESDGRGRGA
jgi:hypothetical protein